MPGVHFIPTQGIERSGIIPGNLRHNHFVPPQGYLIGPGGVVPSVGITLNATLQKTLTSQFSMNASLDVIIFKNISMNATLQKTILRNFLLDAKLVDRIKNDFSLDAKLVDRIKNDFSLDAQLKGPVENNFTYGAKLVDRILSNFSLDAQLKGPIENNFTLDAKLVDRIQNNFSLDAQLKGPVENNFTYNATLFADPKMIFEDGPSQLYEDNSKIMNYEAKGAAADWADTNWKFRRSVTIKTGQITGTVQDRTNFVMLVEDIFPELIGAKRNDIRFAGTAGNPPPFLEYFIEEFDNTTGKIVARVLINLVQDLLKTYLYFDNPLNPAGAESGSNVLVAGKRLAAWPMNQTTFGANSTVDSTGLDPTNNNFTPTNMTIANSVPAKPGLGIEFVDGQNEFTDGLSSFAIRNLKNNFTIKSWFKFGGTVGGGGESILAQLTGGGINYGILSPTIVFLNGNQVKGYAATVPEIPTDSFTQMITVWDSNNDVSFYMNGVFILKVTGSAPAKLGTGGYSIGAANPTANMFNGILGNLEIIDDGFTAAQASNDHNNGVDFDTFFTKGALEPVVPIP